MPRYLRTTGSRGLDRELDQLRLEVAELRKAVGSIAVPSAVQSVVTPGAVAGLMITEEDGSPVVDAVTLIVDQDTGLAVTDEGAGVASLGRTANTDVPQDVATTAAAGTSVAMSNSDHVHKLTLTGADGISVSGLTLALRIDLRTSDPGSPAAGQVWYRTDLEQLRIYDGAATYKSAAFTVA
jgi:hypothetical protein